MLSFVPFFSFRYFVTFWGRNDWSGAVHCVLLDGYEMTNELL